jgi:hypothetical protein
VRAIRSEARLGSISQITAVLIGYVFRWAASLIALAVSSAVAIAQGGGIQWAYPQEVRRSGGTDGTYEPLRQMADREVLEWVGNAVNSRIRLPRPITIRLSTCQERQALYIPTSRIAQVCLGLINSIHAEALYNERRNEEHAGVPQRSPDLIWDGTARGVVFILYHEVAHGIINVLDLPSTGRLETAADELAFVLLLETQSFRDEPGNLLWVDWIVPSGLGTLRGLANLEHEGGAERLADTHELTEQRRASLLCWYYGEMMIRPSLRTAWFREGWVDQANMWLPAARREGCVAERQRIVRSWRRLLGAALRPQR